MSIKPSFGEVKMYLSTDIPAVSPENRVTKLRFYSVLSVIVALTFWHFMATTQDIILASPVDAFDSWMEMTFSGTLPSTLLKSFEHMLLGYAIGVGTAIPLGILMGQSKIIRWAVNPFIDAVYATPTVAYVPLVIVWLGLGFEARVFLVFIFCFFEVLINTYQGVSSIDDSYFDVAKSFGVSWWERQRKVFFPASLPFIFTGLRIGIGRAVRGMIVAELFLAVVNLGALLEKAASEYNTADQLAIIATITLAGLVLQNGIERLEKRALPWRSFGVEGVE